MTIERCHEHRGMLHRIAYGEVETVPDPLTIHLDSCPDCRRIFDRGKVPLDSAALERLGTDDRQRLLRLLVVRRSRRWSRSPRWRRLTLAAALLALALGIGGLVSWSLSERSSTGLVVALVEDHLRYLGRPERHSSLDRTALELDLEEYLGCPVRFPTVPTAELTGGRRCFLLGRRVALAFYARGSAELSYFVLPKEELSLPGPRCSNPSFHCAHERGYEVVTWERSGLLHAVVGADGVAPLVLAREFRHEHDRTSP